MKDERIAYRSLLAMVLQWRNFDGDGISNPLRQDIIKTLNFYKETSQQNNAVDGNNAMANYVPGWKRHESTDDAKDHSRR